MSSSKGREALERDEEARLRDLVALARDQAAEARDRWTEARVTSLKRQAESPDELIRGFERSMAAARALTASDRSRAAADREMAAKDRDQAARDRRQAQTDVQRAHAGGVASVYTRDLEKVALQHEIARANRSGEPLVLAFVAVEGDELQEVMSTVGSNLRAYDPIVRMNGREFVCGLSETSLETAGRRVKEIQAALARRQVGGPVQDRSFRTGPGRDPRGGPPAR